LRSRSTVLAGTVLAISTVGGWAWQNATIKEASGVTRMGDWLLIADDAEVGAYYRVAIGKIPVPLFDLNSLKPQRVPLKNRGLGVDIESIGLLADGRIVLLSERLRSLVWDGGIVAEYDSELAEMGKRGLEGLAIRPLPGGASRVAVVWEGGYPDFGLGPRRASARSAWLPLILVHDVAKNASAGRVRLQDALAAIELAVPRPPGEEPAAQRFRVPDLVWTILPSEKAGDGWGFIALLSSQNGLPRPTFGYKWLQRFNMEGRPVGEALDLARYFPAAVAGANWEGLAWYEPGRKLVLVHEEDTHLRAHAFVMELPAEWQFASSKL
jgi:hypothetical protein